MRYLIDSDWVADWLKGRPEAQQLFTKFTPNDELFISLITFGEIYEGIYYGRDSKGAEASFRNLLRFVEVLPLNRAILRRFARVRGELRAKGQIIGDFDLLIAATALQHGLTLMTRNRRHFDRVPSLQQPS